MNSRLGNEHDNFPGAKPEEHQPIIVRTAADGGENPRTRHEN
jgi:hypothetical protein